MDNQQSPRSTDRKRYQDIAWTPNLGLFSKLNANCRYEIYTQIALSHNTINIIHLEKTLSPIDALRATSQEFLVEIDEWCQIHAHDHEISPSESRSNVMRIYRAPALSIGRHFLGNMNCLIDLSNLWDTLSVAQVWQCIDPYRWDHQYFENSIEVVTLIPPTKAILKADIFIAFKLLLRLLVAIHFKFRSSSSRIRILFPSLEEAPELVAAIEESKSVVGASRKRKKNKKGKGERFVSISRPTIHPTSTRSREEASRASAIEVWTNFAAVQFMDLNLNIEYEIVDGNKPAPKVIDNTRLQRISQSRKWIAVESIWVRHYNEDLAAIVQAAPIFHPGATALGIELLYYLHTRDPQHFLQFLTLHQWLELSNAVNTIGECLRLTRVEDRPRIAEAIRALPAVSTHLRQGAFWLHDVLVSYEMCSMRDAYSEPDITAAIIHRAGIRKMVRDFEKLMKALTMITSKHGPAEFVTCWNDLGSGWFEKFPHEIMAGWAV